jgi:hypothetical protein
LDVEDQAKVLGDFLLSSFDMYAPLKEIKAKKKRHQSQAVYLKTCNGSEILPGKKIV